jgi:small subunit ribosomal protein S17
MSEQKIQTDTTPATAAKADRIIRRFRGVVVSDKMDKTIVVSIDAVKTHPKYHKSFVTSRRYKVHDERNQFKEGDAVTFVQCRPLSKDKRWRVLY